MKLQLSYDLGNQEEEHNVDAQKLAEVDFRGI
jgi:hypothetical protein